MSKILLPMFVGVFVGAFVVEMLRRNNPELGDALQEKAKRVVRALPQAFKPLKHSSAESAPPTTG